MSSNAAASPFDSSSFVLDNHHQQQQNNLVKQLQSSPYARNAEFAHFQRDLLERHWKNSMGVLLLQSGQRKRSILLSSVLSQQQHAPPPNQHQLDWLDRLIDVYQQEGRHYHTATHLEEMLGYLDIIMIHVKFESTTIQLQQWHVAVLILATFFHDAVYDTKSSTNEEDSAKLFQTFFQDLFGGDVNDGEDENHPVPESAIDQDHGGNSQEASSNYGTLSDIHTLVVQLILATKRHELPELPEDPTITWLFATFLDLDMAVLGKQPAAYMAYAHLIRQEYYWVPREEYCEKRAAILQGFLSRDEDDSTIDAPSLYLSTDLRLAWQEMAKDNLREEISLLRKGCIPGEQRDSKTSDV